MTKKGYTHIIVNTALHKILKEMADKKETSIGKLLEQFISINTGINTDQENTLKTPYKLSQKEAQNEPLLSDNAFFGKKGLVGRVGFEPTTTAVSGRYPNQTRRPARRDYADNL